MRDRFLAAGILLAIGLTGSAHGAHPALGEPVPQSSVTAADITVMPDGTGLPPGSGSAVGGRAIYLAQCAQCHGPDGNAGPNDRLVGGRGSLGSDQPVKTVGSYWPYATTLFDYVRRAMPYPAPGLLSDEEVYAVTAYVLYLNEIIGEEAELNATTLPEVEMPNRDGFTSALTGAPTP